jgi:hypothetical protein
VAAAVKHVVPKEAEGWTAALVVEVASVVLVASETAAVMEESMAVVAQARAEEVALVPGMAAAAEATEAWGLGDRMVGSRVEDMQAQVEEVVRAPVMAVEEMGLAEEPTVEGALEEADVAVVAAVEVEQPEKERRAVEAKVHRLARFGDRLEEETRSIAVCQTKMLRFQPSA